MLHQAVEPCHARVLVRLLHDMLDLLIVERDGPSTREARIIRVL